MATQPALELPSNHVVPITRPAIRPQTRGRVIEILAGTANGCLQELGYTPGLIERIKYLEEASVKLKSTNEQLFNYNEKLKLYADELKQKCLHYQSENVKLYEDNSMIIADCNNLRAEVSNLRARCLVNEETRGKEVSEILAQYALLKTQYAEAVKELGMRAQINPPVQLPGSREIRPIQVVPSQGRRVSAPQLQTHPQPHLVNNQQSQSMRPTTLRTTAQIVATPPQRRNSGTAAPLGWTPQHGTPPLPTPTSAGAPPVPPPGYGPYAAGVAGPSSFRPHSGASMGHTAPTTFPPTPPMSALPLNLQNFASPKAGNAHPHAQPHSGSPRTPSSLMSSSASRRTPVAPQTLSPVQQIAPAVPVPVPVSMPVLIPAPTAPPPQFVTQSGDMVPQVSPPEPAPPTPPEMALDGAPDITQSGDVVPPQPAPPTPPEMAVDGAPDITQNGDIVPQVSPPPPAPPAPPEMAVDGAPDMDMQVDVPPETVQVDVPPETAQVDVPPETVQDDGAPPEPQDPGSPPEAHEALTPPLDSSRAFGVTVAADASPSVNGDGGAIAVKAEEGAPTVKMEVDEDGGGEDEDEDEDEDGNEVDYIELGPDGLRTAKDCVAAVFDPDKNFVCRFCEARHNADLLAGIQSEPPPEMPNATLEERAAHCETEHEHVWNILRNNV